jgi:hypothetical protein
MTREHSHNCNDGKCEDHYENPAVDAGVIERIAEEPVVETEAVPASDKTKALVEKVLADFKNRSFGGRHPELGKMIKCQVCGTRHRSMIKCKQQFKELHIEEDLETGEKTPVLATCIPHGAKPGTRQIVGAAGFKGRRHNPHPSHRDQMLIQRSKEIFAKEGEEGFVSPQEFKQKIRLTRTTAQRQLQKEARRKAKKRRRTQDRSRRINRGLA